MYTEYEERGASIAKLERDLGYLLGQLQRAARFAVGHAADCVQRALAAAERIEEAIQELR
jgi:hypothetical protein